MGIPLNPGPSAYASQPPTVFVGWTTLSTLEEAHGLARTIVEARLAECAQVEGPITSIYEWEGKVETSPEYRVTLKFRADQAIPLERWLHAHHPYSIPQWIAVPAYFVGGKYLSWLHERPTH